MNIENSIIIFTNNHDPLARITNVSLVLFAKKLSHQQEREVLRFYRNKRHFIMKKEIQNALMAKVALTRMSFRFVLSYPVYHDLCHRLMPYKCPNFEPWNYEKASECVCVCVCMLARARVYICVCVFACYQMDNNCHNFLRYSLAAYFLSFIIYN